MKKIAFLVLMLSPALFCTAQSTADELAERVLQAFQQRDYDSYKALHITNKIYVNEIKPAMLADLRKHNAPHELDNKGDTLYSQDQLDKMSFTMFSRILQNGTSEGIRDWRQVAFAKLEIPDAEKENDNDVKSGYMWLKYNDEYYCILGFTFMKAKAGYRMLYVVDIKKSKDNSSSAMPNSGQR